MRENLTRDDMREMSLEELGKVTQEEFEAALHRNRSDESQTEVDAAQLIADGLLTETEADNLAQGRTL